MNELIINQKDLIYNINKIKNAEMRKDYTIIAVIKGNAYGLGAIPFANLLIENGINNFAVASVNEALELRDAGIKENVLLLTPVTEKTILEELIDKDITITIDSEESIKIADEIAKDKNILVKAHIKIDTGLARYGFDCEKNEEIAKTLKMYKNIQYKGIFSHFSNSLASDSEYSKTQYDLFCQTIDYLENQGLEFELKHICNSSGYFKYPKMRLNSARVGSAFCGLASGPDAELRRIGKFHTKIARVREVPKGCFVGYANSYITKKKMKIAIIPTGYFEGIGRNIETQRYKFTSKAKRVLNDVKKLFKQDNNLTLHVNGKDLKIVGQIGMHDIVLDVTNEEYRVNDDVYIDVRPVLIDSSVRRIYE